MIKKKKSKNSKIRLFIIIGALIYISFIFVDQQKIIKIKNAEMQELQSRIEEELKISEELKEQKDLVNSPEYIEKMAREKLGMVKPSEKVFVDVNR